MYTHTLYAPPFLLPAIFKQANTLSYAHVYTHLLRRNAIHLITNQNLVTVPDISQSLFGEASEKMK